LGADIEYPLAVTFAQAMQGLTAKIEVDRSETCPDCQGIGKTVSGNATCSACNGFGQQPRRIGGASRCTQCGGTGKVAVTCAACRGHGIVAKRETISVGIPAGVETS